MKYALSHSLFLTRQLLRWRRGEGKVVVVVVVLLVSCRHIRPCEQALAGLAVDGRVVLRWH